MKSPLAVRVLCATEQTSEGDSSKNGAPSCQQPRVSSGSTLGCARFSLVLTRFPSRRVARKLNEAATALAHTQHCCKPFSYSSRQTTINQTLTKTLRSQRSRRMSSCGLQKIKRCDRHKTGLCFAERVDEFVMRETPAGCTWSVNVIHATFLRTVERGYIFVHRLAESQTNKHVNTVFCSNLPKKLLFSLGFITKANMCEIQVNNQLSDKLEL